MATGIEVPLELAVLISAGSTCAGAWATRWHLLRQRVQRRDPFSDRVQPDHLGRAVLRAIEGDRHSRASNAVLHGRIDQLASHAECWSADSAEAVRAHVAAVMRLSLRRQDRIAMGETAFFTILVPGADERAALRVAERLRRSLEQLRLPLNGSDARLTISFGVAAERVGETGATLQSRAGRALDAALAQGPDRVVAASEIEDIMLLPAPASATDPLASAV